MKTRDTDDRESSSTRKVALKASSRKAGSRPRNVSRKAALSRRPAATGQRKSAAWNSERTGPDLGAGTDASDTKDDTQMRSAIYREETGSSDGLYEYVL